jgi:hypothetical protein
MCISIDRSKEWKEHMRTCKYLFELVVLATSLCLAWTGRADADAVIYAISPNNDLMWYRHEGRNDGTFRWTSNEGRKVGVGWNFKHVFSGGNGIIYAITQNNDLMWYRHEGRNDGTFRWTFNEGKKVGVGWNFKHVFSGGNGIIYAITQNNVSARPSPSGSDDARDATTSERCETSYVTATTAA